MNNFREKAALIWGIADLLRGEYKQADYGKVILPLVVLKRLDSVLAPTKEKVLTQYAQVQSLKVGNIDPILYGGPKSQDHFLTKLRQNSAL